MLLPAINQLLGAGPEWEVLEGTFEMYFYNVNRGPEKLKMTNSCKWQNQEPVSPALCEEE